MIRLTSLISVWFQIDYRSMMQFVVVVVVNAGFPLLSRFFKSWFQVCFAILAVGCAKRPAEVWLDKADPSRRQLSFPSSH